LIFLALQAPPSCADAAACRAEAEAAAARGEYETFHDLAWRAMQKGKPTDPALMLLVARAQALSGRPADALVMLQRLADAGAQIDVTLADFDRVRRLPGWDAFASRLSGRPAAAPAGSTAGRSDVAPAGATARPDAAPAGETGKPAAPPPPADAGDALAFDAPAGLGAFAIAHDAVSRRFVVGDRPSRRLLVVDEVSKHVVPYVGAASAGFYDELTALSLDARRGDLWVASVKGSGADATSILHKLQLVSGRGLLDARPADSLLPVRFVDVTIAPDGTALALDAAGGRLFRLRPGSRSLELVLKLDSPGLRAIAAADERTAFVASDAGLARVDLASRAAQPVKSVEDLGGFVSMAWRNGALVGVQRAAGASLVVRIALDASGTRAQPRAILAASPSSIVGTLANGRFYYLVDGTIKRLSLR
jgi:hypothetical protein